MTAKETDVLSYDIERDLEALFNVVYDEVGEKIEMMRNDELTLEEFLFFIDNL